MLYADDTNTVISGQDVFYLSEYSSKNMNPCCLNPRTHA